MFSIFNLYRYDEIDLPLTSDGLKSWLNDIWKQKEKRLADFTATSSFLSDPQATLDNNQPIDNALYLALIFWTLVQVNSYQLLFITIKTYKNNMVYL